MITRVTLSLFVSSIILTGCDKSMPDKNGSFVASGTVAANVNGRKISEESLKFLMSEVKARHAGKTTNPQAVIDEVVNRELLRQELESSDSMKDEKFIAKLENSQRMMLSQSAVIKFLKNVDIQESALKLAYEEFVQKNKAIEYHAKHILLEDEASARDVIKRLDRGEHFEDLVKTYSKDKGTMAKGGDLGWTTSRKMVKEFSDAVAALAIGETTKEPIKTQYGWHIIKLQESREGAAPPYESMKEKLSNLIRNEKLQDHIKNLRAQAKISVYIKPELLGNTEGAK